MYASLGVMVKPWKEIPPSSIKLVPSCVYRTAAEVTLNKTGHAFWKMCIDLHCYLELQADCNVVQFPILWHHLANYWGEGPLLV